MKTIIHIGQHKTGTTSIQHYLQSRRVALAEAGLYVPDTLLGYGNPSHFLLNVYALDENRESTSKTLLKESVDDAFFSDFPGRLKADIARHYQQAAKMNCREIIWSNEGLYLLNSEEEYDRLHSLFKVFSDETLCICCFRDPETWRDSYQAQLEGLGLGLSENPDSYRYLEPDSWMMNYDRKKQLLKTVFPETQFMNYNQKDMVSPFMDIIGYPLSDNALPLRLNPTSNV